MNPQSPPGPLRLGPYELLDRLATGGMAEVFLARREGPHGFQKLVAVKRILPQFSADQEFVSMFIDEARVCAQLSHPNIVQVFDFGEAGGDLYMAMEYVQGTTVARLIRGAKKKSLPLPLDVALYIALSVLRGLDYAHNATDEGGEALQIVHRDVSPGNVLVDAAGAVKLTDFGIARAAEFERRTDAGQLKGKLGYMSPEQVLGQELDPRSDLFTLGIILAELLTLRPLFWAPKELDILMKIRDADVRHLNEASIDPDVRHVLLRALAKEREHRYASAADFAAAIEQVIQRRRLQAVPSQLALFVARLSGSLSDASQQAVRLQTPGEMPAVRVSPSRPDTDLDELYVVERTTEDVGSDPNHVHTDQGPLTFAQLVELVATGQISRIARISKGKGSFRNAVEYPELEKFLGNAKARWEDPPLHFSPLERVKFAATLLRMAHERWTGALMLVDGVRRKRVYLNNGSPELITSSMKDELFGEFLVRRGLVLRMEVDMALAMLPKFDGRLGDALVGLGMLRPLELFRVIQEQMLTRFLDVFTWQSGKYALVEQLRPPEEAFALGVEPVDLVVRGIRQGYKLADLEQLLSVVLPERATAVKNPRISRYALVLTEREDYVLRSVDETYTLSEWVERFEKRGVKREDILRVYFLGLLAGNLHVASWVDHHPECEWRGTEPDSLVPSGGGSSIPPTR